MLIKNSLVIDDTHANTKDHVNDAEDDGQLHFVRVEENDFVVGSLEKSFFYYFAIYV